MWNISKSYVLENPIPLVIDKDVDDEVKIKYQCYIDNDGATNRILMWF